MSEIIDAAIDVFDKQIQALYTNDFEKFLSFMTPRIQKELTIEIFQSAIALYKRTPIDIDAIDQEKSKLFNEGESGEIPDKHVKLILIGSGRTLCNVVHMGGEWRIDDIYWRYGDLEPIEEIEEVEEEMEPKEDDTVKEEHPIQTPSPLSEQEEAETLEEEKAVENPVTDHEEEQLDE